VYLVGENGDEWVAAFICPCGCKQVINLNLLEYEGRPVWKVQEDSRGRASIVPSVWRHVGCKSHFIIRDGEIIWCK